MVVGIVGMFIAMFTFQIILDRPATKLERIMLWVWGIFWIGPALLRLAAKGIFG